MNKYVRTLGKAGSNLLTELSRQNKKIFTYHDAVEIFGSNDRQLRELLSTLVKKGWLQRLEKGKYLILPLEAGSEGEWTEHEFVIASYLVEPYYIGFNSALNYYGYTEQISRTVYIASTRRKFKSTHKISGVTYQLVQVAEHKFFGYRSVSINGYEINISEPEKTIVDCLDRIKHCASIEELGKALWYGREEIDFEKMAEYSVRNGNQAVNQRLGFLIDSLGIESKKALQILLKNQSSRYTPLDIWRDPKGKHIKTWKIILNVPEKNLSQWREK